MNANGQIAGFVLAGGASSRMGRAKALLEIDGAPLVVRAAKLVESVAGTATIIGGTGANESPGLRVIDDDWPGAGPLGAIATALRASSAPWNLIVACDLPHLTREWLEYLVRRALASQADAVLPMNTRGAEPMCAAYHKRGEAAIRAALERDVRKVTDGLKVLRIETIEPSEWKAFDSDGLLFKNVNSPEDFEEAKSKLGASAQAREK
jgi:molybdopterin-guanine dinucleotide biosynthesis protein A